MNHFKLATLVTALGLSFSSQAESLRLVVNAPDSISVSQKSLSANDCFPTPDGAHQWCVGKPAVKVGQKSLSGTTTRSRFRVINIESYGYSASEAAKWLSKQPGVGLVEPDVAVNQLGRPLSPAQVEALSVQPSDPDLFWQEEYYLDPFVSPTGTNVFRLWDKVPAPSNALDIAVLDSSFFANDEVVYGAGASFFTGLDFDIPRDNDFSPRAGEGIERCQGHGLGVAATIAGLHNNGIAGAGVARNVNIHPLRVMECGSGFLSDISDAMHWLAGDAYEGVRPYEGSPGIMNLSLGGPGDTCPSYMQGAIDRAVEQGWTVVVGAGNDSIPIQFQIPANCNSVITVSALNQEGVLAEFSNFGEHADVAARGTGIVGACSEESATCFWDGTSFSTPLVTGVLAEVSQATGVGGIELALAGRFGVSPLSEGACETRGECGNGMLDALTALELAQLIKDGNLNRIEHALSTNTPCEQQWFLDHFGEQVRLCGLYRVTFLGGVVDDPGFSFELFEAEKGTDWSGEASLQSLGTFNESVVMLQDIDATQYDYGVRICTGQSCEPIQPMDIASALPEQLPALCDSP